MEAHSTASEITESAQVSESNAHASTEACPAMLPEATFSVSLPAIESSNPGDRCDILPKIIPVDSITVPNGRPAYVLLVSGYSRNNNFDELTFYNFAKFMMRERGAYVHYAWWNNLLAAYMRRPLHQSFCAEDDKPTPGDLATHAQGFVPIETDPTTGESADKAIPSEDHQFQADAIAFLKAIREHNPQAPIIVAGHSMGGDAVARLGDHPDLAGLMIDVLAPIDPVGNRTLPVGLPATERYNWTRWRATHEDFLGYKKVVNNGTVLDPECVATGPFLPRPPPPGDIAPVCAALGTPYLTHAPNGRHFGPVHPAHYTTLPGPDVKILYHRWQKEFLFPFDWEKDLFFGFPAALAEAISDPLNPAGYLNFQKSVETCARPDPCDPFDGHGEIVGFQGFSSPGKSDPVGLQGQNWVAKDDPEGRKALLERMADPTDTTFDADHGPRDPSLCLVSPDLIEIVKLHVNFQPVADAGPDQTVECPPSGDAPVRLDGSGSCDVDAADTLTFWWTCAAFGTVTGESVDVVLPLGMHTVTLRVDDDRGKYDEDTVEILVEAPAITIDLAQAGVWFRKKRSAVMVSGWIGLPPGVHFTELEPKVVAGVVLSEAPVLPPTPVSFDVDAGGRQWTHHVHDSAGLHRFDIDWKGAHFHYRERHFPVGLQSRIITTTETLLQLKFERKHIGGPFSIDIGGKASVDVGAQGAVTASVPFEIVEVGREVILSLPFPIVDTTVIDVSGSVERTIVAAAYFETSKGRFRIDARFGSSLLPDGTATLPRTLELGLSVAKGYEGAAALDEDDLAVRKGTWRTRR